MTLSDEPVRIGMVGAGFIAQIAHLHALSRIPAARVVTLAEPDDALRTAVAQRFSIENTTADYRTLLERPDIDGIVICVPRRAQARVVSEFLQAKRFVLSEKPMAMTLPEAESLAATAARSGASWTVGYMKRHDVGVRNFRRLLADLRASGELGPMTHATMHDFCAVYGVPIPEHVRREGPRARRYPESAIAPDFVPEKHRLDYEYTVNVASHDINLLRFLFGDLLVATSFELRPGGEQRARFDADGLDIRLTVAPIDRGRWDQALEVGFARGRATLALPSPLARDQAAVIYVDSGGGRRKFAVGPTDHVWAFEAQAMAFIDQIKSGTRIADGAASMLGDLALIDSLWRKAIV
jgi:predicted dehydrogenase